MKTMSLSAIAVDSSESEDLKLRVSQLENKTKELEESMRYASNLQRSILPNERVIQNAFSDAFVMFKPKDIVSGDFYWVTKTKDGEVIVAAADCTGHGVPGAFLTIVGNNLLNQIVNINGISDTAEILTELNESLLRRFQIV